MTKKNLRVVVLKEPLLGKLQSIYAQNKEALKKQRLAKMKADTLDTECKLLKDKFWEMFHEANDGTDGSWSLDTDTWTVNEIEPNSKEEEMLLKMRNVFKGLRGEQDD